MLPIYPATFLEEFCGAIRCLSVYECSSLNQGVSWRIVYRSEDFSLLMLQMQRRNRAQLSNICCVMSSGGKVSFSV